MTATDNRARFPELAELVDRLRGLLLQPRMTCITDHDGNVLAGKLPDPDPRTFSVSAESLAALQAHRQHVASMAAKPWPRQQR